MRVSRYLSTLLGVLFLTAYLTLDLYCLKYCGGELSNNHEVHLIYAVV